MVKRNFGKILTIIIIVLFATGGGIYWRYLKVPAEKIVYTNEKFGYQLTLPKGWRIAREISAFIISDHIIENKYKEELDNILKDFPSNQVLAKIDAYKKKYYQEQLNLEKEWDEKQSQLVELTNISEQEEKELRKLYEKEYGRNPFKSPPPIFINLGASSIESGIDITKLKDGENKYAIVKKITLKNGYQATYLKSKNSQYKNMNDSISIYIPMTNKNNIRLISGETANQLQISFELNKDLSEEQFLEFVNSLKLL